MATALAPVHLGSPEVGSPQWHAQRRTRINGSEIAAVLQISPYESPFSMWHRKAGNLGDVEETPEMYWGNALEHVIRDEFARRHADEFVTLDGGGLWRHPQRAWQGGSPDGRLYPNTELDRPSFENPNPTPTALLECKTDRYGDRWGDEGTDEVPVHYRAQCLWYLDVFGLRVCHIAVLIAGSEYREYRVEHSDTELAPMRAAARAFLDTVETHQQPPIDGHDATYDAVKELHPDIDGGSVELDDPTARAYLTALAAEKAAAREKNRAGAEVITAMGTAQYATWGDTRIASRIPARTDGKPPYLRAANGAADLIEGAEAA